MKNKTKGIGFKNFRRFDNFPLLEFGDITYLVGRNNSGKSTMVKAQLLMMDYLQNQLYNTFSFDNEVLEDANIVTFGRAKNNKSKSNQIEFTSSINGVHFLVIISGDDNATKANVSLFKITDNIEGITLEVDYSKEIINLSKKQKNVTISKEQLLTGLGDIEYDLKRIDKELLNSDSKLSKEYLLFRDRRNRLLQDKEKINKELAVQHKDEDTFDYNISCPLKFLSVGQMYDVVEDDENEFDVVLSEDNMIKEFISIVLYFNDIQFKKDVEKSKDNSDDDFNPDSIEVHQNKTKLEKWADKISNYINAQTFHYIPANPSKQSALFSLRDKNNDLAQAIHYFKQARLDEKAESKLFVKKWMKEFEVGEDFLIKFHAGEAYEFHVIEDGAQNHLSDKGMGSLQIMSLILKLAIILFDKSNKNRNTPTVLIEEPELNLHPELQSKLSDFLLEVSNKNVQFLVETHSEYIIRRAQLISIKEGYILNEELNPNPFKIFYFHKEEGPYEMKFTPQGRFERDFGPGFYDEAAKTSMAIIKEGRKKSNL
jgi:predicted ATPase